MSLTLAEKLQDAEVHCSPFPHLVIDDFLPEDLLASAMRGFPGLDLIGDLAARSMANNANSRASLNLITVQESDDYRLDDLRAFYGSIGLEELVRSVLARLRPFLRDQLEAEAERLPFLPRMSADDRRNWMQGRPSFSFDIQPGINPPSFAGLEPHLDDKYEMFAGLLYLHSANSSPIGGDLIFYELSPELEFKGSRPKGNPYLVKPVKRVAYKHNRFVVLLNGRSALHGVTPYLESENKVTRKLYNIIVESYNVPYKCYGYWDLPRGGMGTTIKHAVSGGYKLLRHKLVKTLAPSRVVDQLRSCTPGELMDRWEFWA